MSDRIVYSMRQTTADGPEVMCWAEVAEDATQMEIGATDTPDGDAAAIIEIYYADRLFARDDGLGIRAWPSLTYLADELRWSPMVAPAGPPPRPPTVDPLDVEYDGVPLRELVQMDQDSQRHDVTPMLDPFDYDRVITPIQRAAISAHWSAQLHAKVAASADRERARVLVDLQEIE